MILIRPCGPRYFAIELPNTHTPSSSSFVYGLLYYTYMGVLEPLCDDSVSSNSSSAASYTSANTRNAVQHTQRDRAAAPPASEKETHHRQAFALNTPLSLPYLFPITTTTTETTIIKPPGAFDGQRATRAARAYVSLCLFMHFNYIEYGKRWKTAGRPGSFSR